MKIALAFWGLTRSLKYTLPSIQENILNKLKHHTVTIFLHTFTLKGEYNNPRAGEKNIQLDFKEYSLLKPDYVEIDDQDKVKQDLNINLYKTKPDPWNTGYITLENFVCAMYSKHKLVCMIEKSGKQFDAIIFLRPDVKYLTPIQDSFITLANENTICVPKFHLYNTMNDRFCIATHKNGLLYGDCFKHLLEYGKTNVLHSESFINHCVRKLYSLNVEHIPFFFNRVRADGRVQNDC